AAEISTPSLHDALPISFPTILMALMVLAILGNGVTNVVFAIIVAEWATYARTARGTALVEREKEYIEAARCLRIPGRRVLLRYRSEEHTSELQSRENLV